MANYAQQRRDFKNRVVSHVAGEAKNWDALLADALAMGFTEDQATAIVIEVTDELWHEAVRRHGQSQPVDSPPC